MKILFSPSESKTRDNNNFKNYPQIYLFPDLLDKQMHVLKTYDDYIKSSCDELLNKLFGLKKSSDIDFFSSIDIFNAPTLKAVERYCGVAYEYLDYKSVEQKKFIDKNMIIFSNLFGPIFAQHPLPNYKLKQGEKLGSFVIEKYYKEHFSDALDDLLKNEFIIDLRAVFYLKFYKPKSYHITIKFIKNGKVISHWAKAYRGKIARELARHQPQNEEEFQKIRFQNLQVLEIIRRKNYSEYVFEID